VSTPKPYGRRPDFFFQGKESGDFCNLFERFWWLNCLMVFGGLKIDENVVGAYLFDGFW